MFLAHTGPNHMFLGDFPCCNSVTQAYFILCLFHPPLDVGVLQFQPENGERWEDIFAI